MLPLSVRVKLENLAEMTGWGDHFDCSRVSGRGLQRGGLQNGGHSYWKCWRPQTAKQKAEQLMEGLQ